MIGKEELVVDGERVGQLPEEAVYALPGGQFSSRATPPPLILDLPDLPCQLKILNHI